MGTQRDIYTMAASRKDEFYHPDWNGWEEVFLCGTEWENFSLVYNTEWKWDFDHLYDDLVDESGDFSSAKKVYIFGTTEPQLVDIGEEQSHVVPIPVLVAVATDIDLPAKLGVKSVQMVEETILPMRKQGMEWAPMRSLGESDSQWAARPVYVLKCKTRRAKVVNMTEVDAKRYEYCLPYIFIPRLNPVKGTDYDSNVSIVHPMTTKVKGKKLQVQAVFDYDWRMDGDVDDFVEEYLSEAGHPASLASQLAEHVKEQVEAAKGVVRAERRALKAKHDAFSPEEITALDAMVAHKYYPQNAFPDVSSSKSKYINRYWGRCAHLH